MAGWYIAASLEKLRAQLNALAPKRSKLSDGGIGDAAHNARSSDHNPIEGTGQVCARDFTHDPAGGLDCHVLAAALVANRDARIKYIIWNHRIWTLNTGWQNYTGENPHTKHLHLSVRSGALGDGTRAWVLSSIPAPGGGDQEDEMQLTDKVKLWDGSEVNVAQLLAGLLGRVIPLHAELVEEQQTLVDGSMYKAGTSKYVRQVDARTYKLATEAVPDLTERVVGLEGQQKQIMDQLAAVLERLQGDPFQKGASE